MDSQEHPFPRLYTKDTYRLPELEEITSIKIRNWRLELGRGNVRGFKPGGGYWLVRGVDAEKYIKEVSHERI